MDENVKKIIKERFEALPDGVKNAILSSDYENSIVEIGKKHNLNVDQMGTLEQETTLVMMGITKTKEFEIELGGQLKEVDRAKISQIIADVNEKIFLHIRDLLKLMNTEPGEEPSVDEEPTAMKMAPEIKTSIPIMTPVKTAPEPKTIVAGEQKILESSGIEVMPENTAMPKTIMQDKMTETFTIPKKETDYSLKNLSGGAGNDPYHEPI